MGNFFIHLFTFRIHTFKILGIIWAHANSSCSSSKNLFKNSFIFIFASIMVFGEKKFISWLPIIKKFVSKLFMHIIAILKSFPLVNNNIMIINVWLSGIYGKWVNIKDMVNEIKIERDRRMAAFYLGFPSEFHIRHQTCSCFN